jgi:hypothetical protein
MNSCRGEPMNSSTLRSSVTVIELVHLPWLRGGGGHRLRPAST